MATSERAYVWTWLPGATEPVVAGRVDAAGALVRFRYAPEYLERPDAISLYSQELPLKRGVIAPAPGLNIAGSIRDGSPDGWGRGVIDYRRGVQPGVLGEIDYMLESGSNRFGALDFQRSATSYAQRDEAASLDELYEAAELLESGSALTPALDAALNHGTTIGGARPKATLRDADGRERIAKFSSSSDRVFSVVNAEAAMLHLARSVGIDVPGFEVVPSLGREALVVDRFDRIRGGRVHAVSALTMVQQDEMNARYATYPDILDVLTGPYGDPHAQPGRDLFTRIAFNMAISNSDDHARNHAALWDGFRLTLSPAYDLAPGNRSGETAFQAMSYGRDGERESRFATLVGVSETYGLRRADALDIVDAMVETIDSSWEEAADVARLTARDRRTLRTTQVLNPAAFYGLDAPRFSRRKG